MLLKSIFSFTVAWNLSLNLISVPSRKNLADTPSRGMSHLYFSLSPSAWHQLDSAFGPYTIDLMALPFNVQVDRASCPLRFFSLFPCARQIRIQMFFPRSFSLVRFWSFSAPKNALLSVVVPDLCPRKFWWPLVSRNAACAFKFGSNGDTNILLFPTRSGPSVWESCPLWWNLWVIRLSSLWDCPLHSSRIASAVQLLRKERFRPSRCCSAFCKPCVVCSTL